MVEHMLPDDVAFVRTTVRFDEASVPPVLVHHLIIDGPVSFDLSFYRREVQRS